MMTWLMERDAAALWMDMGSGKTGAAASVALELIDRLEVSRWLVVGTPRIAAKVWNAEFRKWDHLNWMDKVSYHITAEDLPVAKVEVIRKGKEVKVFKLVNPKVSRAALLDRRAQVYTIHYDLLPRLVKLLEKDWPFDGVILDESSKVSNSDTARFKSLRRIRGRVTRFYELTGTPASNGLEKLFSQVFLMDGGQRLGKTLTEFRETFMQPATDARGRPIIVNNHIAKWAPKPFAREAIYERVRDLCLNIDPGDWDGVPEVIYNTIPVYLPANVMALYREMEDEYIATLRTGVVIEAQTAAVLGNKLLQFCNGTVYDADKCWHAVHSVKLDALEELLDVTNGQVLLAYWYDHDRQRIKERLGKAITDLADDPDFEDHWNAQELGAGMMQASAGSHGLNLQGGGHVACWYGPIYDLEVYLQFNKRLPRAGQKERVIINHFVVQDSIEEDLMALKDSKYEEQEALIMAVRRMVDRRTGALS